MEGAGSLIVLGTTRPYSHIHSYVIIIHIYGLYFYILKFLSRSVLITLHGMEKPHQKDRKKMIHKNHYNCALYEHHREVEILGQDEQFST